MYSIRVRTTQNVFIDYPVASVGDRILAHLLDRIIETFYAIAIFSLLINLGVDAVWVWVILLGFPLLLYSLLFEIFMNGQSPGKKVLNIKVVHLDGTPPNIGSYLIRWLFAFVDFMLLSGAVAVITISSGGKGQRVGDIVAGTSVVKLVSQQEISSKEIFVPVETQYEPTFSQVVQLTERDIELIQKALEVNRDHGNDRPIFLVSERIKSLLGIQTDLPPVKFLYTIIKDFNHITSVRG